MIGRVETDENGHKMLMPNSFYYEFMKLTPPALAVAEGVGRKSTKKAQDLTERKSGSQCSLGYGIACLAIMIENGIFESLIHAMDGEDVRRAMELVSFLCDGPHSLLSRAQRTAGALLMRRILRR